MSFKIVDTAPASLVASAGTFTLAYPAGTSAGSFAAFGHKLWSDGLQAMFTQDDGKISVAFGASLITVTYRGSTSLPANKRVSVQLNQIGAGRDTPTALVDTKRTTYAPFVRIDLGTPKAPDADGLAESQTVTGAGTAFVLDGVQSDIYSGANVKMDVPRAVVAGWTNTAVLTITGKDEYGNVMVEVSASGVSHTGKKAFAEITSIKTSATITAASAGWADVLGLPFFVAGAGYVYADSEDGTFDTSLDGTFVAGVQTAATGTTGDVRGTYDPGVATDAAVAFALYVIAPDPSYLGVDQFVG